MRNKLFILAAISCLIALKVSAKKSNLSIQMLTCIADLIVTGKITQVSDSTYTFSVDQTVKGNSGKEITVKMFREWMCDMRQKKPAPGQELLLFLKAGEKDSFSIIDGSSGERFIAAQSVWFGYYEKSGRLKDVLPALKDFAQSYKMIFSNPYYKDLSVIQLRSDQEIRTSSQRNEFATWLFGEMKSYKIIKAVAKVIRYRNNKKQLPSHRA